MYARWRLESNSAGHAPAPAFAFGFAFLATVCCVCCDLLHTSWRILLFCTTVFCHSVSPFFCSSFVGSLDFLFYLYFLCRKLTWQAARLKEILSLQHVSTCVCERLCSWFTVCCDLKVLRRSCPRIKLSFHGQSRAKKKKEIEWETDGETCEKRMCIVK